ncbi:MAG TPA: alpha-1,2-fucosyltransferase [Syntrophales bacterium]|nr:alpha-1,2-fucosyltransferase [Syntrophales bacterium]
MERADTPLVIVRLNGGLGNQLFQYATGRMLADHHRTELKLDLSAFHTGKERTYRLNHLRVRERIAGDDEIDALCGPPRNSFRGIVFRLLQRMRPYHRRFVFQERCIGRYDPDILRTPKSVYLRGYWQSEKYFLTVAGDIRREIAEIEPRDAHSREMEKEMLRTASASVHVRRGDYVTDPAACEVHGLCDGDYYRRCVRFLDERVKNLRLFIFSDEPDWVRRNMDLGSSAVVVDHNGGERDYEDLLLMSRCRYHIVANSSFSWWGAWLCDFQDKIVLAPRNWFRAGVLEETDIVPDSWIRM